MTTGKAAIPCGIARLRDGFRLEGYTTVQLHDAAGEPLVVRQRLLRDEPYLRLIRTRKVANADNFRHQLVVDLCDWCCHPAARMESLPEPRGTRAWIVVPCFGCDSIENVPSSSFSRSSILMRPSPRLSFAVFRSKPEPESLTVR